MGLDNYTRGQKIFFGTLIVLLAGTFTISAAMVALVDQGQSAPPSEAAEIDGSGIAFMDYQRKIAALYAIRRLDSVGYSSQDVKETLYAKVPALSTTEIHGYTRTGNPVQPVSISLLDIWPTWQDQHLFCHLELVKRAKAAGIEPPSNARIGALLFTLMNAGRPETDKFLQKDIEKEFRRQNGHDLSDLMPTIRDGMMVRDYVESLLAERGATLDQVARIVAGDNEEYKAEFIRLSIDAFMQRATEEVRREHFAWRAARLAGGLGVSSLGMGYDALEEAFDKNRQAHLQADARFTFDIAQAFPAAMLNSGKVPVGVGDEDDLMELTYKAVRDEVFTATDEDKKNIEKRLEDARARQLVRDAKSKDWTEAEWKTWTDKLREEMLKYKSLDEARGDLESILRSQNAQPAAQSAISEVRRRLEENRKLREREGNAALEALRKDQAVDQGVQGYYAGLRQRFNTLEDQARQKLTPILGRMPATPTADDARRLADDFTRALSDLDRDQLGGLLSTANLNAQTLEQQRDSKAAEKEEFLARKLEDRRNDSDLPMTAAESKAKEEGFDHDIRAFTLKIEARNDATPKVEKFIEGMRALLASLEVSARAIGADGDTRLRMAALGQLIVSAQAALAKFAKDGGEAIVPQSLVDKWEGSAQLKQADIEARQSAQRKEAADTRDLTLEGWCIELGMEFKTGTRSMTWDDVVKDEELRWLDFVDGAKTFLEEPANTAGMASGILTMPGKGYFILRLREKTPKYPQSRQDAQDRVVKLAAMQRARQLTIDALEEVRRDVVKNGWAPALDRARAKFGDQLKTGTTEWFTDRMDLPGIYSESDSDLLSFSTSPSASAPDQPFMTRLRETPVRDGVTKLIPEKHYDDTRRRPDHDKWAYMLARLTERRPYTKRMDESSLKEQGYGNSPADLWRNRHLAGSDVVRELITPGELLKGQSIVLHKSEPEKDNQPAEGASQ